VWRDGLWYKLLMCIIKGKMYNVILNLYNNVKSRIKSINAQKTFLFLNFSSSKLPWITKVLSRVEHFFLKIVWFSFKRRNSSEKVLNLLYRQGENV
jgi:hypothetical protein